MEHDEFTIDIASDDNIVSLGNDHYIKTNDNVCNLMYLHNRNSKNIDIRNYICCKNYKLIRFFDLSYN